MESNINKNVTSDNQDYNRLLDLESPSYTPWSIYYTTIGGLAGTFYQKVCFSRPFYTMEISEGSLPVKGVPSRTAFDNFVNFLNNYPDFFSMRSPRPPSICNECYNFWITISAPTRYGKTYSNTLFYYAREDELPQYIQELIKLIKDL